jgi:hypothetical protein
LVLCVESIARLRSRAGWLAFGWLIWLLGCQGDPPRCRFGSEHAVFQSSAQTFHDLALRPHGSGVVALFSDSAGLYVLPLSAAGDPLGPARMLFESCDAGFDARRRGDGLALACARRARPELAGSLTLYLLDAALDVQSSERVAEVGRASQGVALAERGGQLALLWHDAAISGERIWFSEPLSGGAPRQLSADGWDASAPSLRWVQLDSGPRLYAVWAETGPTSSRVVLSEPSGQSAPRVVVQAREPAPNPRLVPAEGGLILAFRDKRERGRKTGLYLVRLDPGGGPAGEIVRAGRADGEGSPVMEACQGGLISALPRTFAGDYFVGVMWADERLQRLTQEQQFYEDSREFDRVALHCGEAGALLLIAERGRLLRNGAALRSTTFRCE